ncbi:hypothetical protein C492_15091 [Natronococcus jeotgali DSM 18795]|uniref:Uncharacterized protein n=1 Tax=Natronococcus jeotgali DSM 18795 TaxID=1227498 RepID=L9X1Z4_9EURY|nr:hypothetical protein C492_15091 [Natronococcus jeotgali DSM 18795]
MVEQSLDCVALWFVTSNGCDCDDERFGLTEDESSKVAMALGGAIARLRVTEFSIIGVWAAVIMDIDEVEADDPRPGAEDHRRLLAEKTVGSSFEFGSWNGVKLGKRIVIGVCFTSGVSDSLDRLLIDSSLEERLSDDPGVEAAAFDSGDRDLREEIKR